MEKKKRIIPGSGKDVFDLVTTYGFPLEFVDEYFLDHPELDYDYDREEYKRLFEEHRVKSRAGRTKKVF